MKAITLIASGILIVMNSFSQQERSINMAYVPTGSVKVNNSSDAVPRELTLNAFWMSNEITNKEYREYVNDILAHPYDSLCYMGNRGVRISCKKYSEIVKDIIDTTVWAKEFPGNDAMKKMYAHYFSNKKFDNYPVVGVSYQQACYYCAWLTKADNKYLKGKVSAAPYRLPMEEEWVYVASQDTIEVTSPKTIRPSLSSKPGKYGLCNFSDNVAEWVNTNRDVAQQQLVRGGSWKNEADFNKKEVLDKYTTADYIGFRIVQSYLGAKN